MLNIVRTIFEFSTYPRAFVLISGVFRLRKPFFLTVCCGWVQLVPSPFSFCSSRSPSRSLDLLARRYSHAASPRPTKTTTAPKVPNTAVNITSRRSIPTWNPKRTWQFSCVAYFWRKFGKQIHILFSQPEISLLKIQKFIFFVSI